jgi:hypothetical protein
MFSSAGLDKENARPVKRSVVIFGAVRAALVGLARPLKIAE